MTDLLDSMKLLSKDHLRTYYGYLLLWLDGFLCSWVKQKGNNILTVTLPDIDGYSTSKFHTYCLAVGRECEDHTPIIDHYMQELEELMNRIKVYCGIEHTMKKVQLGVIAYIADRKECSAVLRHTLHLGNYGKWSLWTSRIDHRALPYCKRFFSVKS
ncbi:LOW QUALITY PROTEIN: hypothetical protein ACHAWF_002245 [Thalassiosira exigua]